MKEEKRARDIVLSLKRAFIFSLSSFPPFFSPSKQRPDPLHVALRVGLASAPAPGATDSPTEATAPVRRGGAAEDESDDDD